MNHWLLDWSSSQVHNVLDCVMCQRDTPHEERENMDISAFVGYNGHTIH